MLSPSFSNTKGIGLKKKKFQDDVSSKTLYDEKMGQHIKVIKGPSVPYSLFKS